MSLSSRRCWICGDPADSREHKFKKSDLMRSSATWAPSDQPYFISGSGWRRIQGPDSRLVKFEKVLCQPCNTTRTQPYDRAYERFAAWVNQKGSALMSEPQINLAEIYGAGVSDDVLNLLKYFAKHLGCRIASDDYSVPSKLAPSLAGTDLAPFEVSLSRNDEMSSLSARGPGALGNFPLIGTYSPASGEISAPYISGTVVGYLDVIYRYDYPKRYGWEGDAVLPSNPTVRLGKYVPGAPHPSSGEIPGSETARRFNFGGVEFKVPVLTPEHMRQIVALGLPTPEMPIEENLNARLRIAHAILAPFYPDVTLNFLEENLTIPDTDALWKCVFPSSE